MTLTDLWNKQLELFLIGCKHLAEGVMCFAQAIAIGVRWIVTGLCDAVTTARNWVQGWQPVRIRESEDYTVNKRRLGGAL